MLLGGAINGKGSVSKVLGGPWSCAIKKSLQWTVKFINSWYSIHESNLFIAFALQVIPKKNDYRTIIDLLLLVTSVILMYRS